jgi:hypothetical protein
MSYGRFRERVYPYHPVGKIGEFYTLDLKTGKKSQQTDIFDPVNPGNMIETHRCWDELNSGPPFLTGGGFYKHSLHQPYDIIGRTTINIPNYNDTGPKPGFNRCYEGGFAVGSLFGFTSLGTVEGANSHNTYSAANPDDISNLGNRAWMKLRPKVEIASVAQTIAEGSQIPGMLKTTAQGFNSIWKGLGGNMTMKEMGPKKVADQFLNVQFGWKPFINDIYATCDVVTNFDSHVAERKRMNKRWMRRKFRESRIEEEEVLYVGSDPNRNACLPTLFPSVFIEPGSCSQIVRRRKLVDIWYSGKFMYYLPEFDDSAPQLEILRKVRQYKTLLGLNVSPATIYKVMPWTWLIDWYVNAGDFIQRTQDLISDSVVAQYFFAMRHVRYEYEYQKVFTTKDGQTHDLRWKRSVETKRRGSSDSPFSFSLNPTQLSGTQLAILTALGLSKT